MKRISYIILFAVAFLLVTCTKRPELKVYKLEFVTETVEKTNSTAKMTVEYSYPTKLESVKVILSENSDLGGAVSKEASITEKTFAAEFNDLKQGTKYHYCYEYSNGISLLKTDVKSFETDDVEVAMPSVNTVEVKEVMSMSAVAVGNVSSDGGSAITSRGFCWSKTANPTVQNYHVEVSGATGAFEGSLTGLEANTKYHVRAYAVNSKGTGYGEDMTFTTTQGLPVVVTSSVTEITATSAKCGGNVTDQGASTVTERGICWSTDNNPTVNDSHVSGGSGTGTYTCSMTDLMPEEIYYVRAYAKNTQGISYGDEVSFTALEGLPAVTTSVVTNITSTTATCGGNVTNQGASTVTERGICWSTIHNPTVGSSHVSSGSGTGTYTCSMTDLMPGTTYYVRAYAKNIQGVTYGSEVEFTTTTTKPTITTGSITAIMQTTATCGGNVTSDGGAAVTARGVCWSVSPNPTVSDSHTTDGSGTGSFTSSITGLTASTTYYVRAYAANSAGTSYGEQKSFTTQSGGGTQTVPTVTTAQVSNITQTTATCGGNVTSDGGATVTARGVCWSTSQNPTVSDSHTTDGSGTGSFTSSITGLTANTTYYVRAYAANSAGTSYGEQKSFTTQSGGGGDHEYVDLGLPSGLLWATCNVGADSPEDYGWYFMWGSVTEGGDSDCSWANCPGNGGSSSYNATALNTWDAANLTGGVLNPDVDAATANWGGGWRMPTTGDWQELYYNTTSTWTTENGVYGRKFTSKTDSSKYIFLPAAGYRYGTDVYGAGSYGYYWSSSLYSSNPGNAYLMYFSSGDVYPQDNINRYYGCTVRPVRVAR